MIALWTITLVLGAVVLVVVLMLLHRVLRPLLEAKRYAAATLQAGVGIAAHVDGLDHAIRTRELAPAVAEIARRAVAGTGGRR